MKVPDWRARGASQASKAGHIAPAKMGGTPKFGKTSVQGKTQPDGPMNAKTGCKLASYTNRRVRHGGK